MKKFVDLFNKNCGVILGMCHLQALPGELSNSIGLGTHLFIKVPRPRDSEAFRSSSQAATCYYWYQSNQSKVEAIPLSALPKDTTSELAGLSPH